MTYLVQQMWLFLGAAIVLTGGLSWFFGRRFLAAAEERAEKNFRTRAHAAEDAANTKLKAVEESYTEQLEQNASQLSALTTDLQSQRAKVSSLSDEVAKWRNDYREIQGAHEKLQEEHEGTRARLRTLDDRLAAALEDADQLDLERKRLRGELERRGSELTKAMEESAQLSEVTEQVSIFEGKVAAQNTEIQELTAQVATLKAALEDRDKATVELQSQLQRATKTVDQREERIRTLSPLQEQVKELQAQLDALKKEHAGEIAKREDEATRLRSRVGELEPMAARVVVLGGQLSEKTAALTSLESQLAALAGFPDRLKESEQELSRARETSRDLEADLARLRGELERAKRKPKPVVTEKSSNGGLHLHDVRDLVKAIDSSARSAPEAHETADVRPAAAAAPPHTEASVPKDDLKRISGIGPKLERRLHGLGYLTYRQIAAWSQEDIDRVEHHLPGFPDRIRRDDWIGQARQLHAEVYGSDLSV